MKPLHFVITLSKFLITLPTIIHFIHLCCMVIFGEERGQRFDLKKSPMEQILENPGLLHLAENIFSNLNDADVEICRNINQISKEILDNPMFWLRKFGNLSQKNQNNWIKDIQSIKNSEKKKAITSYLQWKLKKEALVDLPCYSSPEVQDDFRNENVRMSSDLWPPNNPCSPATK